MADDLTGQVTELLQALIRNACVNDGSPESGHEERSADLLQGYLEGSGLDVERHQSAPGRASLVARIEGRDPDAPVLCLMGHTDVVPVSPAGWHRDPFGGELVDGEVWGRGAVDMLNLTSSMAVAFRRLADEGFRPRGTLVYLAVADEEAAGTLGAQWLAENNYDAIRCDYVLSESGGVVQPTAERRLVTLTAEEKGVAWRRLRVKGTPGHGSMPYRSDNALVKAAAAVGRLAAYQPQARITDTWRSFVQSLDLPAPVRADLSDPERADAAVSGIEDPYLAKLAHACTHMSFSPNVVRGGVKTNVIPDAVDIEVDIRVLPGETESDVAANLEAALGDLAGAVEVEVIHHSPATASSWDTPLREVLERATRRVYPDAELVPRLMTGGTDLRFFREKGAVGYGFGLFSDSFTMQDYASRFHGHDERVDVASLRLTTDMWLQVARDFLG